MSLYLQFVKIFYFNVVTFPCDFMDKNSDNCFNSKLMLLRLIFRLFCQTDEKFPNLPFKAKLGTF